MVDCGRTAHEFWAEGLKVYANLLGPYNPSMPMEEIHERLNHGALTQRGRDDFERGFKEYADSKQQR